MSLQKDQTICQTNESDGSDSKLKIMENINNEVKTRKAINLNEIKGKIQKMDKQMLTISAKQIDMRSPKDAKINHDKNKKHQLKLITVDSAE